MAFQDDMTEILIKSYKKIKFQLFIETYTSYEIAAVRN